MNQFPLEAIEKASVDELRALQFKRLRSTLRHAYQNAPAYRRKFDSAGVHPDDLAVCRDAAAEVTERMGGIGAFEVVDDPRIGRGSCLLETGTGDVDATFESQLARVLEALVAPPDMTLVAGG
jgi:flagellar biosynthesis/type III secretory pathway protein FliH